MSAGDGTAEFAENAPTTVYLSKEDVIANAPADRVEADVEDVFGGTLRVRSLSAEEQANVKQASIVLGGQNPRVVWAEMERLQFLYGVIQPKFNATEVRTLHISSGASFAKVIAKIDEISGIRKEDLKQAEADFPGAGDGETLPV